MIKQNLILALSLVLGLTFGATPVLAHVVVKPNQVGVAAYQTFTVGVPTEKDSPTTSLRLLIPAGLKSVSPNVKPGWQIEVKKSGSGDTEVVSEIDWTGGLIPGGQRDDFGFSAQAPASETTLKWQAYQSFQDGTTVAWDQEPKSADSDDESVTPYSQTKVINDLTLSSPVPVLPGGNAGSTNTVAVILSGLALIFSGIALAMQLRKR